MVNDVKLELDGEYLVSSLQVGVDGLTSCGLQSIKVIRETDNAFRLVRECGKTFWFLKSWDVSIIEGITHK